MNDKKYKGISGATVVVFIAVIFFVLWMTSRVQMRGQEITFTQFEQEIKDDNVTEVVINQNKAVPTGVVTLTLRDSRETGRVNVSDVNETQKLLDKNDVEYRISAIPQDSVLSTTVLPVVLMLVGFMFITMMMNRQSGGANAKAMNFGKSRARMSSENDKKVTFADVAGLQEEKEEVRQKRTEELAGRLIGYLGETQEGAALYRILSRDIGMTDNEIRGMGYGALAPYFDREEYAKTIAEWMMDDGTKSTLSGSWAVPFGNLQKRFGVDLKTDTDLRDRVSRVLYDQSDIVADFCMEEDRVRLDFFYSRCPHVYEHGAETAEPAMDQSM